MPWLERHCAASVDDFKEYHTLSDCGHSITNMMYGILVFIVTLVTYNDITNYCLHSEKMRKSAAALTKMISPLATRMVDKTAETRGLMRAAGSLRWTDAGVFGAEEVPLTSGEVVVCFR